MQLKSIDQFFLKFQDKEIGAVIDAGGRTITVTVMPSVIYDHIVKW